MTASPPEPLVSIVIPCFNYARFLAEAIESALAQTYSNTEIIVVDDGSTDDSRDVARRYPVRVLALDHGGVCSAFNRGVEAAIGELIIRLDADDVLLPDCVQRLVTALSKHPDAVLAYGHGYCFGAREGPFHIPPFDAETLAEGGYVTCCALIRRHALELVGGLEPRMGEVRCEDWDLWLSFAERDMRGVLVDETLWGYRHHGPTSRSRADLRTLRGVRRELLLIARLQDRHPMLFAPAVLLRRLVSLPTRVLRRQVPLKHAALLVTWYSLMLARTAWHAFRGRPALPTVSPF